MEVHANITMVADNKNLMKNLLEIIYSYIGDRYYTNERSINPSNKNKLTRIWYGSHIFIDITNGPEGSMFSYGSYGEDDIDWDDCLAELDELLEEDSNGGAVNIVFSSVDAPDYPYELYSTNSDEADRAISKIFK